jgi:phospholipid-binding lipoprotein MlaA
MTRKGKRIPLVFMTIAAGFMLASCSATQAQKAGYDPEANIQDPMEGYNRAVFSFNDTLDRAVLEPVAQGYHDVVPHPARMSVRNFLRNLRSPVNAINQLLQGDVEGFASDVSRAAINTTIGIGGLFDVAKETGLEYEYEDFGQTLAVWGVDHGPYMVLPVMGPSSLRDTTGLIVDTLADPVRLYLYNTDNEGWYYARAAATGIDKREELLSFIDDLRRNSYDYYAAMRSVYYQKRHAMVNDEDPNSVGTASIPNYDKGEE